MTERKFSVESSTNTPLKPGEMRVLGEIKVSPEVVEKHKQILLNRLSGQTRKTTENALSPQKGS